MGGANSSVDTEGRTKNQDEYMRKQVNRTTMGTQSGLVDLQMRTDDRVAVPA